MQETFTKWVPGFKSETLQQEIKPSTETIEFRFNLVQLFWNRNLQHLPYSNSISLRRKMTGFANKNSLV